MNKQTVECLVIGLFCMCVPIQGYASSGKADDKAPTIEFFEYLAEWETSDGKPLLDPIQLLDVDEFNTEKKEKASENRQPHD